MRQNYDIGTSGLTIDSVSSVSTVIVGPRAARADAIDYSLIESCKVKQANPLAYLTYVL